MNMKQVLGKAMARTKNFLKDTKKTLNKNKREFVKSFKREYTGKKQPKNFMPGALITFEYDAIDAVKKFDKTPLCVMLGPAKDNPKHAMGLNVHWLPMNQRVALASLVVEMLEQKNGKLEYEDIKPILRKFEGSPILRRYAIRRVSSKVIQMPPEVYLRAASLDAADWSK